MEKQLRVENEKFQGDLISSFCFNEHWDFSSTECNDLFLYTFAVVKKASLSKNVFQDSWIVNRKTNPSIKCYHDKIFMQIFRGFFSSGHLESRKLDSLGVLKIPFYFFSCGFRNLKAFQSMWNWRFSVSKYCSSGSVNRTQKILEKFVYFKFHFNFPPTQNLKHFLLFLIITWRSK